MSKKSNYHYIKSSNGFIDSAKENYRINPVDFTRDRKLPFEALVLCMLKLLRRNLQMELNSFFKALNSNVKSITSSAFVQSRKKLKPDLFYDLNRLIVSEYYSDNDENITLYKGHRLLSIDGSTINLPLTDELKTIYGKFNNQKKTDDVVLGRVSVLYDVLNNIVLDGKLCPYVKGEVSLSREHFKHTKQGDVLVMDRAYPSFESAWLLHQQKVDFLFRCKISFSNQVLSFYNSGKNHEVIQIKPTQHRSFKELPYTINSTVKVRLIRIVLPSKEVEILMTSLLDDKKYPARDFKALYFKRWKIETFYDRFKNIIGVECFSGTSHQFIQQEFNCALYLSNMQTILTEGAQDEVEEKYKGRMYEYKVNSSLSLGFIRERLIQLYATKKEPKQLLDELQELLVKNVVPIRHGRKNKRDVDKYRQRTKPKQFKNRRLIF